MAGKTPYYIETTFDTELHDYYRGELAKQEEDLKMHKKKIIDICM